MVIINTRAVDVSIQAVSPALILSRATSCGSVGAGGAVVAAAGAAAAGTDIDEAGAGAVGVSAAQTACADSVLAASTIKRNNVVINAISPEPDVSQIALASRSPVRMRTTCESSDTKILPSPTLPVFAARMTASIT